MTRQNTAESTSRSNINKNRNTSVDKRIYNNDIENINSNSESGPGDLKLFKNSNLKMKVTCNSEGKYYLANFTNYHKC